MSWVKLDDQFLNNPKVVRAGKDGRLLYLASLLYCGGQLTDGNIPREALNLLAGMADIDNGKACGKRLLEVGLWEETPEGYCIHDYLKYNPTREEALALREARAEAGSRGGLASVASKAQAKAQAIASANGKQNSTPSPSPSPSPSSPTPFNYVAANAAEAASAEVSAKPEVREDQRIWASLRDATGSEPQTDLGRGSWNKGIKSLRKAVPPVLASEIPELIGAYRNRWPDIEITPTALAKHLHILRAPPTPIPKQNRGNRPVDRSELNDDDWTAEYVAKAETSERALRARTAERSRVNGPTEPIPRKVEDVDLPPVRAPV